MTEQTSGLNMNELYLAPDAATNVAKAFEEALPELEQLRQQFRRYKLDLGMGHCNEGRTWNEKVTGMAEDPDVSVTALIDAHIENYRNYAQWARVAQKEYNGTDHRSADSYAALDQKNFYQSTS